MQPVMHRPRLLPLERGGFLLSLPRSVPRARPLVRPRRRNRQAEEEECRGCFVFAVSSDIGDDENLDVTRDDISEGDLSPLETADDAVLPSLIKVLGLAVLSLVPAGQPVLWRRCEVSFEQQGARARGCRRDTERERERARGGI